VTFDFYLIFIFNSSFSYALGFTAGTLASPSWIGQQTLNTLTNFVRVTQIVPVNCTATDISFFPRRLYNGGESKEQCRLYKVETTYNDSGITNTLIPTSFSREIPHSLYLKDWFVE